MVRTPWVRLTGLTPHVSRYAQEGEPTGGPGAGIQRNSTDCTQSNKGKCNKKSQCPSLGLHSKCPLPLHTERREM